MPSSRRSAAPGGSPSRKKPRNGGAGQVEEVAPVVSPAIAFVTDSGKDDQELDSATPPNDRRATLRKRSAGGGMSSGAGSLSETPRRKIRKGQEEAVVAAAEVAEAKDVKVFEGEAEKGGCSSLRFCSHSWDVPTKGLSPVKSSSKRPRKEGKRNEKGVVVLTVDETAASEEDVLEVEEDEVILLDKGDDAEIKGGGDEVMDALPKRRVSSMRNSTEAGDCKFIGQPMDDKVAKKRWPKRYQGKAKVKGKGRSHL